MVSMRPRIIVTGASGFVGRLLVAALKDRYHVYAFARRSQAQCNAPEHPNIDWIQVDIAEREPLTAAFEKIRVQGGVEALIHLAAYYDFTGEENPEYHRTNVVGLENILDLSLDLGLRRFIFASSVAACPFPEKGQSIDETTPPFGNNVYARSKRIGEEMIEEYRDRLPTCIVRFAALYSDWCEYPPLFNLLNCWFSQGWNARMLGGNGSFAIPYLHVRCAVAFFENLLDHLEVPDSGEVFIAGPDGATSQLEIYEEAALAFWETRRRPIIIPKAIARLWLHIMNYRGRIIGNPPFERPWMGRYIDRQLTINSDRTRRRLNWGIRPRLKLIRRIPFLVENFRTRPVRWNELNNAAMRKEDPGHGLMIQYLLEKHEETICQRQTTALLQSYPDNRFGSYHQFTFEILLERVRSCVQNLQRTIRTREMEPVGAHCRLVARERFEDQFSLDEVIAGFACLGRLCIGVMCEDKLAAGIEQAITDRITIAVQFCIDEIQDEFEVTNHENARKHQPAGKGQDRCFRSV